MKKILRKMYDSMGNEYEVAAEIEGIKVGYEILIEDNKPVRSQLELLNFSLYDRPPTTKKHKEIEELNTKIDELNEKLRALKNKLEENEEQCKT